MQGRQEPGGSISTGQFVCAPTGFRPGPYVGYKTYDAGMLHRDRRAKLSRAVREGS
jgi:hypothetical protein